MKRALFFVFLAACSEDPSELSVFAAASLGPALEEAGPAFEREHEGARVRVVAAGSQILRRQIEAGAPADVFVPASDAHADALADRIAERDVLICNRLVIATRRTDVRSVRDLANVERLVVGTPEVPIGAYTETVLARAGERWGADVRAAIEGRIVSRELDTRQVLAKVLLGEADAAIVYASDAEGEDVRAIPIDDGLADVPSYPIAVMRESERQPLARSFVAWLRSPAGAAMLTRRGFVRCE